MKSIIPETGGRGAFAPPSGFSFALLLFLALLFNSSSAASITLSKASGAAGSTITVSGSGFTGLHSVPIQFYVNSAWQTAATCTSNAQGAFSGCGLTVPAYTTGTYSVRGTDGTHTTLSTSFQILPILTLSQSSGPPTIKIYATGSYFLKSHTYCEVTFGGAVGELRISAGSSCNVWISGVNYIYAGCKTDINGKLPVGCPLTVPIGLGPGTYTVSLGGGQAQFTIPLGTITPVPSTGGLNSKISLTGSNLVANHPYCELVFSKPGVTSKTIELRTGPGTSCNVWINGVNYVYAGCSTDLNGNMLPGCSFTVPSVPLGTYTITASIGVNHASGQFTVGPTVPTISLNYVQGSQDQQITVTGSSLIASHLYSSILFNGRSVSLYTSRGSGCTTDSSQNLPAGCYFYVPDILPGNYPVQLGSLPAPAVAPGGFTINQGQIQLTPTSGSVGAQISVTGSNLRASTAFQTRSITYIKYCIATFSGPGSGTKALTTGPGTCPGSTTTYSWAGCGTDAFGNMLPGCYFYVPSLPSGPYTVSIINGVSGASFYPFNIGSTLSLNPPSGGALVVVTATGTQFSKSSKVTMTYDTGSGIVNLVTTPATITTNSAGKFVATFVVPASSSGAHTVKATDLGGASGTATYTITGAPKVSVAATGVINQIIPFTATYFAASTTLTGQWGSGANSCGAETTWAPITLTGACRTTAGGVLNAGCSFKVPNTAIEGATGSAHQIKISDGSQSFCTTFEILNGQLVLGSSSGTANSKVTISGYDLAASNNYKIAPGQVTFCSEADGTCTNIPLAASPATSCATDGVGTMPASGCSFIVPINKPPGKYLVTLTDGPNMATAVFSIDSPKISLNPNGGFVGQTISITGSKFQPNEAISSVTFNGAGVTTSGVCSVDSGGLLPPTGNACTFMVPLYPPGFYTVTVTGSSGDTASYPQFQILTPSTGGTYSGNSCTFAGVNTNDWIDISGLIVLCIVTIAGLVYAFGNLMGGERRERFKGAATYQIYEALLSLIIICILFALTSVACQAGAAIVGQPNYEGVFATADSYVANLLFVTGFNVVSNMYATSIQYLIIANVYYYGSAQITGFFGSASIFQSSSSSGALSQALGGVSLSISSDIDSFLSEFSNLFTEIYGALMVVTFGGLFVLYFFLPIIQAGALTVVLPLSIIMRAIPFAGPRIRETSNMFLALAIGLYLVFPLTIVLNQYMMTNWLCINFNPVQTGCTNTFFGQYLQGYGDISSITSSASSLFTGGSITVTSATIPGGLQGNNLPTTFFGSAFGNLGQFENEMLNGPASAQQYGYAVAAYLFLGLVMVALDIAITMGFVFGLTKGLNFFNQLFGAEPIWGS